MNVYTLYHELNQIEKNVERREFSKTLSFELFKSL
jgi:hypothetical protein